MLTWLTFGTVAVFVSFLANRGDDPKWSILSYLSGALSNFMALVAWMTFAEVNGIPPTVANAAFGPFVWCSLVGPALGIYIAKRRRTPV